jgi:hypothetical protein
MAEQTFVYVTYIRTTPEKLWSALTHTIDREPSKLIAALSSAWPMAISNLKSLLENGSVALEAHP